MVVYFRFEDKFLIYDDMRIARIKSGEIIRRTGRLKKLETVGVDI